MKLALEALEGLYKLPRGWLRRLAGPPLRIDGQELDVQNQLLIRTSKLVSAKKLEEMSVSEARAMLERATTFDPPRPKLAAVRDVTLDRPAYPLGARIYEPLDHDGSAIVYFHGGGWVIGSSRTSDCVTAKLAAATRALVVSVDYRLAPEHAFPTAANDAIGAFDWVRSEHQMLGIDPDRIAVAGDSAGGNLAAVVAQAREDAVCYQLLVYPAVDLSAEHASYAMFTRDLFLTAATMRWFIERYTPDAAQRHDVRASPLLAEDLSRVAPAGVFLVGFDPLRDEGRAYAARLEAVGKLDELYEDPSLAHACITQTHYVERASYFVDRCARALRRGLSSPSSPAR